MGGVAGMSLFLSSSMGGAASSLLSSMGGAASSLLSSMGGPARTSLSSSMGDDARMSLSMGGAARMSCCSCGSGVGGVLLLLLLLLCGGGNEDMIKCGRKGITILSTMVVSFFLPPVASRSVTEAMPTCWWHHENYMKRVENFLLCNVIKKGFHVTKIPSLSENSA